MAIGAAVTLLSGCATVVTGTPTKGVAAFPSTAAPSSESPSASSPTDAQPTDAGSTDDESPIARAQLLTADELPAAWRVDTAPGGDSSDPGTHEPSCLDDVAVGYAVDDYAEGDWVRDSEDSGIWLTETIGLARSVDEAKDVVDTSLQDFLDCRKIAYGSGSSRFLGAMTPISATNHPDDSHAYKLVFTVGGDSYTFYYELIRKGSTLMDVLAGGYHPVTQAAFEQIVAKAYQKLK
ncbi:hypothetical protein SAMN05444157_1271 [Frankineae bacterium MT45]|nr:hypothetical protein SAMN05444157_1271 [Frankineae bacterium MT45]